MLKAGRRSNVWPLRVLLDGRQVLPPYRHRTTHSAKQNRRTRSVRLSAIEPGERVLVAGATGGVGQLVVAKLLERGMKVGALTRDKSKARSLFGQSQDINVVEVDLRDKGQVAEAALYDGCQALIACLGTTAFPSARWKGDNGPRQTDWVSASNLLLAAPPGLRHVAWCSSAGVDRRSKFPFFILNTFGVLSFKKAAEDLLRSSGLPFTIVRPSRLTDGPYTSYDLNTLLKATSGMRQAVLLSSKDELQGQASRIATAELLVQSLLLPELEGVVVHCESQEGDGPGSDTKAWSRLVQAMA